MLFFFNIYSFLRVTDRVRAGEGQKERETQNPKQAPGSRLWAVGTVPDAGLKLTDREIMTGAEVRCLTEWVTQAPLGQFYSLKGPNNVKLLCIINLLYAVFGNLGCLRKFFIVVGVNNRIGKSVHSVQLKRQHPCALRGLSIWGEVPSSAPAPGCPWDQLVLYLCCLR